MGQNFTAATFGIDANLVPPDSNGAIGPNHFVEFINGRFSVFNKSSGARVQTSSDIGFWNNAGVAIPGGALVSDPRVIYDPGSGRWFASQIDFFPGNEVSNRFLLAVSATSDPTGSWSGVGWMADPGGSFADYPRLGLDAKGVYLTGNQFDLAGNLTGVLITSIPKADLLLGSPTVSNRTTSGLVSISERGFTLQPVVNFAATNNSFVVAVESDGTDFQTHNILKSFEVQGADSPSAVFTTNIDITVPDYFVPINPPQPNGDDSLDDGDVRIGGYVFQVGDVVYAAHAVEEGPRAVIRWYRLRASDHTLLEAGTLSDPDLDLFYPSIAANTNGFVVIGCNGTSTNMFISSYGFAGRTINGTTVFGSKVLLKAGAANYQRPAGRSNRWGDYSTTTVDWGAPNHFWTIQEFPSAENIWSTQVTEVIVSETLPNLTILPTGTNIVLSWPTNDFGFSLQAASSIAPSVAWSPMTNPVVVAGTLNTVSVSASDALRFFRLAR